METDYTRTPDGRPLALLDLLAAAAAQDPDAPAVLAPGRRDATRAQTLSHLRGVGRVLAAAGLTPTTRVAVLLPDSAETAAVLLGVMAHAIAVPLSPKLVPQELLASLTALRADAVITPPSGPLADAAAAVAPGLVRLAVEADPDGPAGAVRFPSVDPGSDDMLPARGGNDVMLVAPTGGTTGRPKAVPLTHTNVLSMMRANVGVLGLTPGDRCLSVMPLCHIHGLGAVLCSLLGGGSVAVTPGFSADAFFDWARTLRPTWYTAVPTVHQAVLAAAERGAATFAVPPLRLVRSGSAPMPAGVPERLESLFGATYVEAFGATETSAYLCSNRPADRRIGTVGRPMPGVELIVRGDDGRALADGETGELVARGPGVFAGYDHDPAATAGSSAEAFSDGYFRTGDLGVRDADGFFRLVGRAKERINRAGAKVLPGEIEAALLTHPAVLHAAAFGVPDERLGQDVAAAVVLRPGVAATPLDLQRHAAERLADYKVPRRVLVVDALPTSAVGKVRRLSLAEAFGLAGDPIAAPAGPADAAEQTVAGVWAGVLGRPVTDVNASFFDLGGDSLQALRVCLDLEARFGRSLPLASLSGRPTVRAVAALLADDGWRPAAGAPVVLRDGRPGGPTLFLLPGMGGNCFSYHALAHALPAAWRVVGLPLPGADGLEPPVACVDALAERFLGVIRADDPTRPFTLAGYSFGGRLAYAIAQRLAAAGESVRPLLMFDTATPNWPPPMPRGRQMARRLRRALRSAVRGTASIAPPAAAVALLPTVPAAAQTRQAALTAACAEASARWRPRPADIAVRLLRVRPTPRDDVDLSDATMGWGRLARGGVTVIPVTGRHETLFAEPNVAALTARVVDLLGGPVARAA